ncbi:MAG: 4-oxalocrotonate tautomerase [Rubritepida sp.]|nr:4-oxalocrotonate tautomerase [Rubritepida sp.]
MPVVNLQMTQESDDRAGLHRDAGPGAGEEAEHTHVIIQEIDDQDWGFAGALTDEWRRVNGGG